MTKASATKVFSMSTSTTTKTIVSQISRIESRGSAFFLSLALGSALSVAAIGGRFGGGTAVVWVFSGLSAMRHLDRLSERAGPLYQRIQRMRLQSMHCRSQAPSEAQRLG